MATIDFKRGDSLYYTVLYKDADGLPIDVTGYTIECMIRYQYDDVTPAATAAVVITDATNGTFTIEVLPAVTALFTVGWARLDIQYTDGSSRIKSTDTVNINIIGDITR